MFLNEQGFLYFRFIFARALSENLKTINVIFCFRECFGTLI